MSLLRGISNEAIISVALAILASIVSFRVYDPLGTTGDTCTFFDYGAVGFGVLAVIAGAVAIIIGGRGNDVGSSFIGGLALLVGIYRVGYGLGYAFGPCS